MRPCTGNNLVTRRSNNSESDVDGKKEALVWVCEGCGEVKETANERAEQNFKWSVCLTSQLPFQVGQ
jgi:hypothetical protein